MLNTIPLGPRHNLQQRAVRPAATAAPPRVVRTAIATSTAVVFTLTPTENNIHRKNNFSSLFLFQLTLHPTGCGAEVVSVLADLTAQAPHRDVEAAPGLLRPLPVLGVHLGALQSLASAQGRGDRRTVDDELRLLDSPVHLGVDVGHGQGRLISRHHGSVGRVCGERGPG